MILDTVGMFDAAAALPEQLTVAVFTYGSDAPAGIGAVALIVWLAPDARVTVSLTPIAASVTVQVRSGVSAAEVLLSVSA